MEVSGQLHTPVALSLRKEPPVPIIWEVEWAPEYLEAMVKRKIPVISLAEN
jgi:hypothetical protein